jgi:hypothetical protein
MTRARDGGDLRCARTNVRNWTGVSLHWVVGRARDGSDAYTVLRHGSVRSHVTLVHRARDPHASRQGGWADDDGLWAAHGIVGDALGSAVRAAPSQRGVSRLSRALRLGQQVALIAARRLRRSRDHGGPQSAFAARRVPRRSMARTHGAASRSSASRASNAYESRHAVSVGTAASMAPSVVVVARRRWRGRRVVDTSVGAYALVGLPALLTGRLHHLVLAVLAHRSITPFVCAPPIGRSAVFPPR